MRTKWLGLAAVIAGIAFTASMAGAQALSPGEKKFIQMVGEGGRAEVELGRLAQEKASSDQVKQFGQRMADDHGKAGKELAELASRKGVTVPNEISGEHGRLRDRLARFQGSMFDKQYVKEMVKDHKKDVAEFRRMSKSAKDGELKAWVDKTLPTLEDHLRMVQDLDKQLSTSR